MKGDTLPRLPNVAALRDALTRNDGAITVAEQYELGLALALIEAIEFEDPETKTQRCLVCGSESSASDPDVPVPIKCAACTYWTAVLVLAADRIPMRFHGHNYTIDTGDPRGPIMTVRFPDGAVLVSTRVRCQGRLPKRLRERREMQDNVIIVPGNPMGLPRGFHEKPDPPRVTER